MALSGGSIDLRTADHTKMVIIEDKVSQEGSDSLCMIPVVVVNSSVRKALSPFGSRHLPNRDRSRDNWA